MIRYYEKIWRNVLRAIRKTDSLGPRN